MGNVQNSDDRVLALQPVSTDVDARLFELTELRLRIQSAHMPGDVEQHALREVQRLGRIPDAATEHALSRAHLDWLLDLPWAVSTDEHIDIPAAREILESEHHGLARVKRRIMEFLAVRKL